MSSEANVTSLVEEYRSFVGDDPPDSEGLLEDVLVRDGDWTPEGAAHLCRLAKANGSFMLRSALAVSLVLGIEDGELGF